MAHRRRGRARVIRRRRRRIRVLAGVTAVVALLATAVGAVAERRPGWPAAFTAAVERGGVSAGPAGRITAPAPDSAHEELTMLAAIRVGIHDEPAYVTDDGERITTDRVRAFLERKGSPLAPYADDIVAAGLANDVDPRLIVAIAGIESSYGRRQAGHNAWGWGGSARFARWPDWPTAIAEYTRRLTDRFDTDDVDESFARRYTPPNWQRWLTVVRSILRDI